MEQVRQALDADPLIAERIAALNDALLGPLQNDASVYEPSAGLVDKVLQQVDEQSPSVTNGLGVDVSRSYGSESR